jgi:hypothetical protein
MVSTQGEDREALSSPDLDFLKRVDQALQRAVASAQNTAAK